MIELIVSNSSCLISLERINRLEILQKLFNEILIPPAVHTEIGFSYSWLKIKEPKYVDFISALQTNLGLGESEAIALAFEIKSKMILDDAQARKIAERFKLKIIGTIGILLLAKQERIITKVNPIIEELEHSGFYLSAHLKNLVITLSRE